MERNGDLYVQGVLANEMASPAALDEVYARSPESCLWVLVDRGEIVGSVGVKGINISDSKTNCMQLELTRMYVDASRRGMGYGRRLIEHVYTHARKNSVREVFLTTPSVNAPAIGFYRRLGFVIEREIVVQGPDGADLELLELLAVVPDL